MKSLQSAITGGPLSRLSVFFGTIAVCIQGVTATETKAQVHAGWIIETSGIISPANPVVAIRVSGWFDYVPNTAELFQGGRFDLLSMEEGFVAGSNRLHLLGSPGFLQPDAVRVIVVGQGHEPPHFQGNPSNPILVFSVDWTTDEFTPRRVPLNTMTAAMSVFHSLTRPGGMQIPLQNVMEGTSFIRVVPGPGFGAVAAVCCIVVWRRRR